MLTHHEIQEILVSLESKYVESYKNTQDALNPVIARWILRDVNREIIKKIKKKYDRN